jgi:hypothetical protein
VNHQKLAIMMLNCGFLTCVAGSFKREVWLYDKVNKEIFIEKLETVDWITLVCPFEDVDDMHSFAESVPDTYLFPNFTGEPRFVIRSNSNCLG